MSNGSPDESELFHPIQNLTNLIWLAKLEPDNPEKVLRYLTLADAELLRLTEIAHRLFPGVAPSN
jgi:hypothetical protein